MKNPTPTDPLAVCYNMAFFTAKGRFKPMNRIEWTSKTKSSYFKGTRQWLERREVPVGVTLQSLAVALQMALAPLHDLITALDLKLLPPP